MKNLLESEYLLSDPRVVLVAEKMGINLRYKCEICPVQRLPRDANSVDPAQCEYCTGNIISGSLADAAEAMRDKLCPHDDRWAWELKLIDMLKESIGVRANSSYALRHATATQRIVAAVVVWEAQNAPPAA